MKCQSIFTVNLRLPNSTTNTFIKTEIYVKQVYSRKV